MTTVFRLNVLLAEHGIQGKQLAEALGVSEATVTRWRSRSKVPPIQISQLDKIAAAIMELSKSEKRIYGKDLVGDSETI